MDSHGGIFFQIFFSEHNVASIAKQAVSEYDATVRGEMSVNDTAPGPGPRGTVPQ